MSNNQTAPNLLVVEDEELIVDLLVDYFEEIGYMVTAVTTAEDAIQKLGNGHNFNLVLTDINLPGKSGIDLLKIIKQTKNELPVILLTGHRTVDFAISALKSGAQEYITKPFDLPDVRKIVEKVLKRQTRSLKKERIYSKLNYLQMNFTFRTTEINPDIVAYELAELLQKMHFSSDDDIQQYKLVFTETLTNSIEHGNLELPSAAKGINLSQLTQYEELKEERLQDSVYAQRSINIAFECNPDLFSFSVQDDGAGFDWKKYVNSSFKISDLNTESHGRGFQIIRHLIDEVHFNKKGNVITLIKHRPQPD